MDSLQSDQRQYAIKPTITKQDWECAFAWNKKNKAVVKLESTYYTPAGSKTTLTKNEIRHHLFDLELGASTSFDEWIEKN